MAPNRSIVPPVQELKAIRLVYPKQEDLDGKRPFYFIEDSNTQVMRFDMVWFHGFSGEPKYKHLLMSKLVFAGTDELDSGSIESQLRVLGCEYGFTVYEQHAVLKLTALKKNADQALKLLLSFFHSAAFPDNEIHVLKNMETANLESRFKTPEYWASRSLIEQLFPKDHPKHRVSEVRDIIDVNRESLKACHATFNINSSSIFIYGDINNKLKETLSEILNSYGSYTAGNKKNLNYSTKQINKGTFYTPVANTNQALLQAGYLRTDVKEQDMPLISLMNVTLGGFFGSRLMKEIREKRGLTYGIGSSVSWQNGLFKLQVSCQMNSQNVDLTIDAIKEIIHSLHKNGISSEEFERAKRYFLGQLYRSVDAPHSMLNKIQHSLSKGKGLDSFEKKCEAVLNAKRSIVNELVKDICSTEEFAWCLAGDVS